MEREEIVEQWLECFYHPDYEVSDLGNVRRKKDGKILKLYPQKSGYVNVWLTESYGNIAIPVHRLVCIAFHGTEGYGEGLFVDHINTDRADNRAVNLHWVTPEGNMRNPNTLSKRKKVRI